MIAHGAKVTTAPIPSAQAVVRSRCVATVQTRSGHIKNFAETARPESKCRWPHLRSIPPGNRNGESERNRDVAEQHAANEYGTQRNAAA